MSDHRSPKPLFLSTKITARDPETDAVTGFRVLTPTLKSVTQYALSKSPKSTLYFGTQPVACKLLHEVATVATSDALAIEIRENGLYVEHYRSKPFCRQFIKWQKDIAYTAPAFLADFETPTAPAEKLTPAETWIKKAVYKLGKRDDYVASFPRTLLYGCIAGDGIRLHVDYNLSPSQPPELEEESDPDTRAMLVERAAYFHKQLLELASKYETGPIVGKLPAKALAAAVKTAMSRNRDMIQVSIQLAGQRGYLSARSEEYGDLTVGLDGFESPLTDTLSFYLCPKYLADAVSGMKGEVYLRYTQAHVGIVAVTDAHGHVAVIAAMNPDNK